MEKIKFEATINAPAEKVYSTMLADATYRQWTAEFNPSSYYEGKWETGAKILFVGISKEGKKEGMIGKIREAIPNVFVSIEYVGIMSDGAEIISGPQIEGWAGAQENYSFKETNGQTLLQVEMDTNSDFKAYFETTWPKALNKLKSICENN
jgi:uncharacterized protein YndB with AHSA1/START domain